LDWLKNDPLFIEQVGVGRGGELFACMPLLEAGFVIESKPKEIRRSVEERHLYADEADIWVGRTNPIKLEVKRRPNINFTCPEDIPANRLPLFVTTVNSWEGCTVKPRAVLVVSANGGIVWASGAEREDWMVVNRHDNMRGFRDDFLAASREHLYPFDALVKALKRAGV
jgi:hypothetical protein